VRHDDLLSADLRSAADGIRTGEIDPVELTDAYLRQIEATEAGLNAYVTVDAEGAREAARRARDELSAGRNRGPLHGIPVGVKDIVDTAGLRTTYGSIRYTAHVPNSDADSVARLREAGAVILGKHATHEFAWGGRTDNPHFGPTHNPHDRARIPGGSSGGSAASVASRSSLLAIGTDTAGSVRIPAALSGCVGYKPARGVISTAGVFPLAPTLDHVGVLARTVADARLAVEVLANEPDAAAAAIAPDRLRIGVIEGPSLDLLDADVTAAVERAVNALKRGGATLVEVELGGIDERAWAVLTVIKAEAEAIHREAFLAHPASYGPDLAELLSSPPVPPDELDAARATVASAIDDLRGLLRDVDVVMTATVPIVAPPIGAMTTEIGGTTWPIESILTRLTSIANAAGLPAVSVPAPGTDGLPVGIQLIGNATGSAAALAAAELLE